MKRIVLSLATVAALVLGGVFATTAEAHQPPRHHHHHHHHHHCPPRYSYGYGATTGYPPYNVYRAPFGPYASGYSGGYQPSRAYAPQRFGLYLGSSVMLMRIESPSHSL